MKLQLNPKAVYRVPRFPHDATLEECWEELKSIIQTSSKDFYQQIRDTGASNIHQLPERTRLTIWKYFNRARYRCVPYGSLASVALLDLNQSRETPLVISSQREVHSYTDWPAIADHQPEITLDGRLRLLANSSWYLTTDGLRYLSKDQDGYQLTDNVKDDLVLAILKTCSCPVTYTQLEGVITSKFSTDEAELRDLIQEMISLQMLFTSSHSHIIGEDYWQQIKHKRDPNREPYQISTSARLKGTFPDELFQHVPELARRFHRIVARTGSESLQAFVEAFTTRFEGREVPLMVALDPEMGVGFAGLESAAEENDLVAGLAAQRTAAEKKESDLERFLQRTLSSRERKVIQLEELEQYLQPDTSDDLPLPNTTSLMCTPADGLLIVDLFGGATATALHGRFTLASEQIHEHCKALSAIEAGANPDVLFFDIAYQAGNRIDNVNRRRQLYPYSLSILQFDTSEDPLSLNDIMVSVSGGTVLLRSKRLNKRLIPRMASAYNYTKSDLPVFRFLCEVQQQGIQSYLKLGLSTVLSSFRHHPRIQFKNIVVSPARWFFHRSELIQGKVRGVEHFRQILAQAGIERYFKHGLSDQTLLYDIRRDQDLKAFLHEAEKLKKTVEIEEAFISTRPMITDERGRPYCCQLILSYTHNEQVYRGVTQPAPHHRPSIKLPGSEWLYLELLCHPQRSTPLLLEYIEPFIKANESAISQWFFIRYQENGPHLRVRLKLHDPGQMQPLLARLGAALQPEIDTGILSDLTIRSYRQERHRYHPELMEKVEAHFCIDSRCVLTLIGGLTTGQLYRHCLALIEAVGQTTLFEPAAFRQLIKAISASFNDEHRLTPAAFSKINQAYKDFIKQPLAALTEDQQGQISALKHSLIWTLQECMPHRRNAMFGDLIHMHVNRLFDADQRTHEMLIYYYCHKHLLSQQHQLNVF